MVFLLLEYSSWLLKIEFLIAILTKLLSLYCVGFCGPRQAALSQKHMAD